VLDYEWQLVRHLLPWFGRLPLSAISVQEVDRYRQAKVREGELSATSINKTLTRLAQILEIGLEYNLIGRNPAKGRNRRLKASKYRGTCLDSAAEIEALLEGAGELDAAGRSAPYRRALVAVLVFAGLRIDEALSLRWRHVNLPARTLRVAGSKTDAGVRTVDLMPVLVDELISMLARAVGEPDALVFGTSTGGKQSASNVRNRLLAKAATLADAKLAKSDYPPLPEPLTPHSLRRTFASVLFALGEPVPYVMDQLGHTDPKVTLGIYARVMRRSDEERVRLRALVDGGSYEESVALSARSLSSMRSS
jgi:integrase